MKFKDVVHVDPPNFEDIKNRVNYRKWFFGHYHDNINVSEKEIMIYEQMIRIS